ncbi:transposase, Mutator family protein [Acinetobacter baumannii 4749]|uniref:IS256-like element ISAba26 family transposase n=1 Tax=Acinetobacter baumannii TaxID=470 RepID=UPI00044B5F1D|nr:IS256-like element ISAba26 family transposase [Acinetobacter baumannii]EXC08234.1 transposase, Mutator family protein [Acinetobacter baumannii 4749]
MDEATIKSMAAELAKGLKTPEDLNQMTAVFKKFMIETALNTELSDHLGYEKHQPKKGSNSRNGFSSKTITTQDGQLALDIPRDREGSFEPQIIKKHQTRITSMDDQILSLYAKGMTNRESFVAFFKEMYDADVSASLISKVTDAVIEQVTEWQNRALDSLYPVVYLDCIVVKVRQHSNVINKSVYLALGINMDGQKELLGMWIAQTEGAKFWLSVMTELKNRGVQDILVACVDGLKGFPDAIASVYPHTDIQLCIVHVVRNSLRFVSWKDYKAVTSGLKAIYQASTEENALKSLDIFCDQWNHQYPKIGESWRANWENIRTIFSYPAEIRHAIYTTNAIESLNNIIRHSTKKRKIFSSDDSVKKVIYLATSNAAKKWTMPIQNWRLAMNWFTIQFDDRLKDHL